MSGAILEMKNISKNFGSVMLLTIRLVNCQLMDLE